MILVKAVPRPSKTYSETVCCAGVTDTGAWRRLYPIRFRQLQQDQQFSRWHWVQYGARQPRNDNRKESRRLEENTIERLTKVSSSDRLKFLLPLLRASTKEAVKRGESLCLVEPRQLTLKAKRKSASDIAAERARYRAAAAQASLFDKALAELEPCPFAVQLSFLDQEGQRHAPLCGDWETSATFFKLRAQGYSDESIICHLEQAYTSSGPHRRTFLAMGTVVRRPQVWLLLGVLRVAIPDPYREHQGSFSL